MSSEIVVEEEEKYRPIQLEQHQVTNVVGEWPKFTQISMKMLCEPSICKVTDAGKIEIVVNNGCAVYRLAKEQTSEYVLCLELENYVTPSAG